MVNKGAEIRQQMDETMAGLTGKIGELEHQVSATVRTVKDSVNTVRDTFDVKLHVRRRPWTFLAGATALGFLGGLSSSRHRTRRYAGNGRSDSTPVAHVEPGEHPFTRASNGTEGADLTRHRAVAAPGWLANLGVTFQPEIAELKGIFLGSLLELVRETVTKQVSKSMARPVSDRNNGSKSPSGPSSRPQTPRNDTADV
jgi:ElaB/YqjD/DUF883 family membrane-anchored ribosome-binding protein